VLSLLAEQPRHGYAVNRELEWRDVRDWAGVSRPQVYYSLAKLARMNLIGAAVDEAAKPGPEREVYKITADGRAALKKSLTRGAWATQRPPPPFLTWMALSAHANARTIEAQLKRRRRYLEAELARERKTLVEFVGDSYAVEAARLMVTLTIRHFEVELEWLESTKLILQHASRPSR